MTRQEWGPGLKSVKLLEERGETSRFIDAEIQENGDLVVSAQDVGKAPLEWWGDSDYEFWVTVAREDKHRLLQALLEHKQSKGVELTVELGDEDTALLTLLQEVYGGHFHAVDEFRDFLKSGDIPFQGMSWA
jgi:hypothetical protein